MASIGLSVGALSSSLYSMIVTMAVLTTCAMPPARRYALARTLPRPGEEERIDREAFEANGFVANMERFLIAASDHPNGWFASRLAGLLAGSRGKPMTVFHVELRESGRRPQEDQGRQMALDHAREARPDEAVETPNVAVKARAERATFDDVLSDEAQKGYDFLMIGLDPS